MSANESPRSRDGGSSRQGMTSPPIAVTGAVSSVPPSAEFLEAWTAGYLAGYDRGYESRVDEENQTYPPPKVFTFGRWYNQALEREKADAETRRLVAEASR